MRDIALSAFFLLIWFKFQEHRRNLRISLGILHFTRFCVLLIWFQAPELPHEFANSQGNIVLSVFLSFCWFDLNFRNTAGISEYHWYQCILRVFVYSWFDFKLRNYRTNLQIPRGRLFFPCFWLSERTIFPWEFVLSVFLTFCWFDLNLRNNAGISEYLW